MQSVMLSCSCLSQELQLLFCVPNVIYLYDLQMNIVKAFSLDSIKSEFENVWRVKVNEFF